MKICSLYGAGFYYMPGTDTCIKIGGFVRAEVNVNSGGSYSVVTTGDRDSNNYAGLDDWRTRAGVTLDTRSQTEYGTLRSYFVIASTSDNSQSGSASGGAGLNAGNPGSSGRNPYTRLWSNAAFIQFAGFTAGRTGSFFDFDTQSYSNQTNFWGSNLAGGGIDVFAYTAQFGNGLSASIAAEDANGHRTGITSIPFTSTSLTTPGASWQYGNQQAPDVVGNLRLDQAWGSAQVMGAYHELVGNSTGAITGTEMNSSGFAVGAGLKINVPMLGKGDFVIAQANYSDGASLYAVSNGGNGFDRTRDHGATVSYGPINDAVVVAGGFDKTKVWSITGGYEHHWNSQWKTSLYGAYGEVSYSDAASAVLLAAGATPGSSANWNYAQVGSRTVWTPVQNLDLSLEVMYNHLETAFAGPAIDDESWVSGMFRVQRNFYP